MERICGIRFLPGKKSKGVIDKEVLIKMTNYYRKWVENKAADLCETSDLKLEVDCLEIVGVINV